MFKKKRMVKKKKANILPKEMSKKNGSKCKIEFKKRVKSFECSWYGHLRNKCHNFKRNKEKSL